MKLRLLLLLAALPLLAGCARKNLSTPELYTAHCARCHGRDGRGDRRHLDRYPYLDLLASPMVRQGDRAAVRIRIVDGDGPMPGFARRLTPSQIERLVDFTFQLGHSPEKEHP
ncbi:MAG TPA: cytochrome c [Thermoanaerobaculia bacterium]|nr:cytochrome c [Thermoanaerobaculia bacterium]